jgi:hypothetical protein
LAWLNQTNWPCRMVVRSSDQYRSWRNPGALLDLPSCRLDHIPRDDDRVGAHQRHSHCSIIKNRGSHCASIVKIRQLGREITSGKWHPNLGRDVTLGKARPLKPALRADICLTKVLRRQRIKQLSLR